MSDENLNNNSTEETAALFVSAQKKKKAEEEARRKAAEEQAKIDAAAAEVRRMEQEVEERKRKAEEERKALEEAEKQRQQELDRVNKEKAILEKTTAVKDAVQGALASTAENTAALKNKLSKKLPMFIGIGVAAVALIVVAVILISKIGPKDLTTMDIDFDSEYVSEESDADIPVAFPSEIYGSVEEESQGDASVIHFIPSDKKMVSTDVIIAPATAGDGNALTAGKLGITSAKDLQDQLESVTKSNIEDQYGNVSYDSENRSDITDTEAFAFNYDNGFVMEDGRFGVCAACYLPDEKGECHIVAYVTYGDVKNVDNIAYMNGLFVDSNINTMLPLPGANPSKAKNSDDLIKVEEIHLGIPVPSDVFKKAYDENGYQIWSDENGASIIVQYFDAGKSLTEISEAYDIYLKNFSDAVLKEGADFYLNKISKGMVESRTYVADQKYDPEKWAFAYHADFEDTIGGIKYWERYHISFWHDITTDQTVGVVLITLVPSANKDDYSDIVSNAFSYADL